MNRDDGEYCSVYSIANEHKDEPFKAGYICSQKYKNKEIDELINPFEPDTFDGQEFNEGVYSHKSEKVVGV